jgi:hypothetical protein
MSRSSSSAVPVVLHIETILVSYNAESTFILFFSWFIFHLFHHWVSGLRQLMSLEPSKMKVAHSFETSGTPRPSTQHQPQKIRIFSLADVFCSGVLYKRVTFF